MPQNYGRRGHDPDTPKASAVSLLAKSVRVYNEPMQWVRTEVKREAELLPAAVPHAGLASGSLWQAPLIVDEDK